MRRKKLDFHTRRALCATARKLYVGASKKTRVMQSLRPLICPFDELLPWIPRTGRVLDVGCGAGLFLGLVGSLRPEVTGIGLDRDLSSIAAAKTMAKGHFPDNHIRFECRSLKDPWPAGYFEVVSMVDVLHHIPPSDQRSAINKAFGKVTPGGLFIYKDMARRPFLRAWWNRLHDLVLARQWIHYRPISEVMSWLRQADAEIIEGSTTLIGPYAHEMIVAKRPS
jgi:2-polyprenyl-3-methyl-5-hydroxy-6-metoxy-1,4-benzoquinol methylase